MAPTCASFFLMLRSRRFRVCGRLLTHRAYCSNNPPGRLLGESTMGTRVFVGGLTYRVRERDLEKFFRKYGRIKEIAMKNGFAFVVSC
ncbi:hypothetical protein ANN_03423 [Periplaneta americana]|uniref:RRM domain-containing protein n=1 Tax=Periplaneta americana TaxID=6978 RepID=A0ABQ8U364_PERAM|nr:hypothetical protein ANN_03423 [Periplaneta americana]